MEKIQEIMGICTFCLLMMAAFSSAIGMAIITPFLPELAGRHGANGFWIGMIFAGFGISRGIITPFIGRVSDRIGRKVFVVSGLLLYVVASLLYCVAHSVQALTLVRFIHGISAGMILPIVMTYVGELSRRNTGGLTTGTLNMVLFFGLAVGSFVGGELAERYGFNSVFYTMAAMGAITFLLVSIFLPDVKGQTPGPRAADTAPFNILVKYNYIKAVLIMTFVSVSLMAVFLSFLPSMAMRDNIDITHIGFIIAIAVCVGGFLQIPFGRLADHFDRTGKLLQSCVGLAISMTAISILPFCPDFKALVFSGMFIGFGLAVASPVLSGISVDIGLESGMGTWMGVFWSVMSFAMVAAPITAGIIMDNMGIDSVFYTTGIISFFAVLLSLYYIFNKGRIHTQ